MVQNINVLIFIIECWSIELIREDVSMNPLHKIITMVSLTVIFCLAWAVTCQAGVKEGISCSVKGVTQADRLQEKWVTNRTNKRMRCKWFKFIDKFPSCISPYNLIVKPQEDVCRLLTGTLTDTKSYICPQNYLKKINKVGYKDICRGEKLIRTRLYSCPANSKVRTGPKYRLRCYQSVTINKKPNCPKAYSIKVQSGADICKPQKVGKTGVTAGTVSLPNKSPKCSNIRGNDIIRPTSLVKDVGSKSKDICQTVKTKYVEWIMSES
jgi:hypothetical protein